MSYCRTAWTKGTRCVDPESSLSEASQPLSGQLEDVQANPARGITIVMPSVHGLLSGATQGCFPEFLAHGRHARFCELWFACSQFGLFRSVTKMFETIALWVVLVLFAFGTWLIVGAVWGMATDSSARRSRR